MESHFIIEFSSKILTGHTKAVRLIAFSSDGRYFLSRARNGLLRLWDLSTTSITSEMLTGHTSCDFTATAAAFSPDSRYLVAGVVTGVEDGTLRLWDLSTTPITSKELPSHTQGRVLSLAFSPDGRYIVSVVLSHGRYIVSMSYFSNLLLGEL